MTFDNYQDAKDYYDYCVEKRKEIPQELLDQLEEFEAQIRFAQFQESNSDEYIFNMMWAHNKYPSDAKYHLVHELADQLMSDGENAKQPCLLLGKVQCGKTDSFQCTMSLCFDKGIDVAVVMTKGTKTLTGQALARLRKDFKCLEDKGLLDQKYVVAVWDIMEIRSKGAGFVEHLLQSAGRNKVTKLIIVCKKQLDNLESLNKLFDASEFLKSQSILICDDEADFASRAYLRKKVGEKKYFELLKISNAIEELTKKADSSRYLQITATPYSMFLQPDGTIELRNGEASPWLPRYTGIVPIHSKYVGGQQYYVDSEDPSSMYSCLYHEVQPELIEEILSDRAEWYLEKPAHRDTLTDLTYAIITYMFSAAIRSIQVQKSEGKSYNTSCLIHCEINKKNHGWQKDLIDAIFDELTTAFVVTPQADQRICDLAQKAYYDLQYSFELAKGRELEDKDISFPSLAEVEKEIQRILRYNDYDVKVVNSDDPEKVKQMIDKENGQLKLERTMNIFIGGSILDRGITINNMLCFFYGRDPEKFQMDTVLQHARMYGARSMEDMACTRFYTTDEIYGVLKSINDIDNAMYEYLRAHKTCVRTEDFTSMVIGYDRRVKATSANKYTPSNTTVLRPYQRVLPKGLQTGTNEEIKDIIAKVDEILQQYPDYRVAKEGSDEPCFLLDCETAKELIRLISSTYVYGEEYNNVGFEWDANEMITAIEYASFDSDGYIWCQVYLDRDADRERGNIYDKRGRFNDSPEGGSINTTARKFANDRPVLTLLRQQGREDKHWRNAEFYWPSLMLQKDLVAGIFTINANKRNRKDKKQFKLKNLHKYPSNEVLVLPIKREFLFDIILGDKDFEDREIKNSTRANYLERNEQKQYLLGNGDVANVHDSIFDYNDGEFKFMLKKYKYLYLKSSQDYSGSQIMVSLQKDYCSLEAHPYTSTDRIYQHDNQILDVQDDSMCIWHIIYHLDKVLEVEFTEEDKEYFEEYNQNDI